MTLMNTPATNNTIAFLMTSNNEDIAQDLANEVEALKLELERVKKIAMHRLEVHAKRMEIVTDHDPNLARELAALAPLNSSMRIHNTNNLSEEPPMDHEMDHGYRGAIPR